MSNIILQTGTGRRKSFSLNDANAFKDFETSISICRHGGCAIINTCPIRRKLARLNDEDGILSPITSCDKFVAEDPSQLEILYEK